LCDKRVHEALLEWLDVELNDVDDDNDDCVLASISSPYSSDVTRVTL